MNILRILKLHSCHDKRSNHLQEFYKSLLFIFHKEPSESVSSISKTNFISTG